jgi:hypothetical protein
MNSIYQEKYEKEHVTSFPIETKRLAILLLKNLRTTARKFISDNDTKAPPG